MSSERRSEAMKEVAQRRLEEDPDTFSKMGKKGAEARKEKYGLQSHTGDQSESQGQEQPSDQSLSSSDTSLGNTGQGGRGDTSGDVGEQRGGSDISDREAQVREEGGLGGHTTSEDRSRISHDIAQQRLAEDPDTFSKMGKKGAEVRERNKQIAREGEVPGDQTYRPPSDINQA